MRESLRSGFFIQQLELLGQVGQRRGGRDILRVCLAVGALVLAACGVIHGEVKNLNVQEYRGGMPWIKMHIREGRGMKRVLPKKKFQRFLDNLYA